MSDNNDWKGALPPEEEAKMLEMNPYRPSNWFFPTPHEGLNRRYIIAWDKGKYWTLDKLVDYMKRKGIPKALMVEFFREVTKPDFQPDIEPINYPK